MSSDNHSIEFDVERDNICQGNSLIAVRDKDGNIMWSWHIWVTDYALTKTYEVHNNPGAGGAVTSYFMEVPLGWCDPEVRVDGELRKFHITVKQTDTSGETGTISIPHVRNYTYGKNAPYYQWGRKDPFLPSNGMGDIDKPYYDNQYTAFTKLSGAVATNIAIQHPNIFYLSDSWSSTNKYDFWNFGNTVGTTNNNTVYKTIYSPSPCNYVEPKTAALTGFTTTGGNTSTPNQFNVSGGFNRGWNFYCNPNFIGNIMFFPALGTRISNTGVIGAVGGAGYCWFAGPAVTATNAHLLYFDPGYVTPQNEGGRAYGFPSLPVLEK